MLDARFSHIFAKAYPRCSAVSAIAEHLVLQHGNKPEILKY